jgi:hypothetical protein
MEQPEAAGEELHATTSQEEPVAESDKEQPTAGIQEPNPLSMNCEALARQDMPKVFVPRKPTKNRRRVVQFPRKMAIPVSPMAPPEIRDPIVKHTIDLYKADYWGSEDGTRADYETRYKTRGRPSIGKMTTNTQPRKKPPQQPK